MHVHVSRSVLTQSGPFQIYGRNGMSRRGYGVPQPRNLYSDRYVDGNGDARSPVYRAAGRRFRGVRTHIHVYKPSTLNPQCRMRRARPVLLFRKSSHPTWYPSTTPPSNASPRGLYDLPYSTPRPPNPRSPKFARLAHTES